MRPSTDEALRRSGSVGKTNPKVNRTMSASGKVGPVLLAVGAVTSVRNVAMSEDPSRALAQESGAWVGALSFGAAGGGIGAKVGAAVGVFFGGGGAVPGAVIGGVVGSIVGGVTGAFAGEQAGENVYNLVNE
jgi:outer membrane lipoprotein SlyB